MSTPSLLATLGLDVAGFRAGIRASEESLKVLETTVKESAAVIAVFEQRMRDGGTTEQIKQLDQLRAKHREYQVELKNTQRQVAAVQAVEENGGQRGPGGGNGGGGNHGGGGHGNNAQAGHSVRAVFDMVGAGQNLGQALQMELPRLLQAAGQGLGAMIGIQLGATITKAVAESLQAVAVAREKQADLLRGGTSAGTKFRTDESLTKQTEELDRERQEMLDESGAGAAGHNKNVFQWMGRKAKDVWRWSNGEKGVEATADDKMVQLDERRIQLSSELARRAAEHVALDERAWHEGEHAVALDKERLRLREEIAKVQANTTIDATAQAQLINGLKEESHLRELHIEQVKAQHEAEIKAAAANAKEHKEGKDSPITKAKNAFDAANAKRNSLVPNTPEWEKASAEADERAADLREARQQVAARDAKYKANARVSEFTGPEVKRERLRLNTDQSDIKRQLENFTAPDYELNEEKRKALVDRQNANNAALRKLDRGDVQRGFQRDADDIDASQAPGPQAKLNIIKEQLRLNRERQADNKSHENDPNVASALTAEAAKLRREKDEILFAEKQTKEAAKGHTSELQLQTSGHQTLAAIEASRLSYELQIAAALREGKTEIAAQLAVQRDLHDEKLRFESGYGTGAQKVKERQEAQDLKARKEQYRTGISGTRDADKDGSYHGTGGSVYQGGTKAVESAANNTSGSFDEFFKKPDYAVRDMPDPESLADEMRRGAENAGTSDVGGKGMDLTATNTILERIEAKLDPVNE